MQNEVSAYWMQRQMSHSRIDISVSCRSSEPLLLEERMMQIQVFQLSRYQLNDCQIVRQESLTHYWNFSANTLG